MLNKTTENVTVKNDENQQMVRVQQMKKAAGALSIDDVISSDITIIDMESSRKKADVVESYNPDARYPVAVFEASAVAQSIQSTKKQLLSEVL
ncbi:hypothetical protein F511_45331 [Dorcoceras hygrometricum]|uniref:Uncharacterized protein n=1 Tax=Dorcoceras hygrometricum TaxID=472368 RepID=A0A2Z6ZWA5_9LAMI|nr:hypothetical protein F511_45331 [Dorcoceras hygrometricum]